MNIGKHSAMHLVVSLSYVEGGIADCRVCECEIWRDRADVKKGSCKHLDISL